METAFRADAASLDNGAAGTGPRMAAFDGKTLRGSFDTFSGTRARQVPGAFAPDMAPVLAPIGTGEKSSEIPAVQKLMERAWSGRACGHLRRHAPPKKPSMPQPSSRQPNGSLWSRQSFGSSAWSRPSSQPRAHARHRRKPLCLSSRAVTADLAASAIRAHCGIGNRLHSTRDATLCEDASRIRKNPGIFAGMRSFACHILRHNQSGTIAQDRYAAAPGGLKALFSRKFSKER